MELTIKTKVIISVVALATAAAIGRYSLPERVITKTETVTVEKIVKVKDTDTTVKKDKKYKKTITEIIRPDGTKEVTTVITEDTSTGKETTSRENDTSDSNTIVKNEKEVINSTSKTTILGTFGMEPFSSVPTPIYGVFVSRPVLGPITFGAGGNSKGELTFGIGLQF